MGGGKESYEQLFTSLAKRITMLVRQHLTNFCGYMIFLITKRGKYICNICQLSNKETEEALSLQISHSAQHSVRQNFVEYGE